MKTNEKKVKGALGKLNTMSAGGQEHKTKLQPDKLYRKTRTAVQHKTYGVFVFSPYLITGTRDVSMTDLSTVYQEAGNHISVRSHSVSQ